MNSFLQDIRYGLRTLAKRPGFTAVAALTLALGIGATTAIYSVVDGVLLKPLPYEAADRMVVVRQSQSRLGLSDMLITSDRFLGWVADSRSFETLSGVEFNSVHLGSDDGEPSRLVAAIALPDLFDMLGLRPIVGRNFHTDEFRVGNDRVAMLTEELWLGRFGASDVTGRRIKLEGEEYVVVGVLPSTARFALPEVDLLLPMPMDDPSVVGPESSRFVGGLGLLRPGRTAGEAAAEIDTLIASYDEEHPNLMTGWSAEITPFHEWLVGDVRPTLLLLLGAVGFVLLIASANVASLMVARGASRENEVAIRAALGATRSRISRQLITENVVLSLFGGALGVLLALWATEFLLTISPADVPRLDEVGVDRGVLLFALAVSIGNGLVFGLVPALGVSRPDLKRSLNASGTGTVALARRRLRSGLTVSQLALALVLLVGAGLMMQSLVRLWAVDPGFRPDGAVGARVSLPEHRYADLAQRHDLVDALLQRLEALPEIEVASAASWMPLTGSWSRTSVAVEGVPQEAMGDNPFLLNWRVAPGYFRSMGIPVLRGRGFDQVDAAGSPGVVTINRVLAQRLWPEGDALGKRLKLGDPESDAPWLTVVGVVGEVRDARLDSTAEAAVYLPYRQSDSGFTSVALVLRGAGERQITAAAIRTAVWSVDPDLPVTRIGPLSELISGQVSGPRFNFVVLGTFAFLAMILAAVGIYGSVSQSVAQRVPEFGVRMALGAEGRDVMRLVFGQGIALITAGLAVGLALSLAATRLLTAWLFEVSTTDPTTYALVSLFLAGVALIATLVPALRATRVDPMVALR